MKLEDKVNSKLNLFEEVVDDRRVTILRLKVVVVYSALVLVNIF